MSNIRGIYRAGAPERRISPRTIRTMQKLIFLFQNPRFRTILNVFSIMFRIMFPVVPIIPVISIIPVITIILFIVFQLFLFLHDRNRSIAIRARAHDPRRVAFTNQ